MAVVRLAAAAVGMLALASAGSGCALFPPSLSSGCPDGYEPIGEGRCCPEGYEPAEGGGCCPPGFEALERADGLGKICREVTPPMGFCDLADGRRGHQVEIVDADGAIVIGCAEPDMARQDAPVDAPGDPGDDPEPS